MVKTIILCGMPAVGKTTVAKLLASKLNLNVVGGGDILKEIALEQGYNAVGDDWWDTEEGMKFMEERKGSPELDREVDRRLLSRARKGDIVITSYTLPWLADDGLKVWLSGSKESRAERMARRDASTPEECAKVIDARDRKNYLLYKKVYGISFGKDWTPFTVVIGTDGVPAEKVTDLILEQISRPGDFAVEEVSDREKKKSVRSHPQQERGREPKAACRTSTSGSASRNSNNNSSGITKRRLAA